MNVLFPSIHLPKTEKPHHKKQKAFLQHSVVDTMENIFSWAMAVTVSTF